MMLLIYNIIIYFTIKIIFSLYMQEIYINIFQKTNLIELLEYRIHKTNTVDRLEYLHRNSLQTTKGHVRVPTGFWKHLEYSWTLRLIFRWEFIYREGDYLSRVGFVSHSRIWEDGKLEFTRNTWKLLLTLI